MDCKSGASGLSGGAGANGPCLPPEDDICLSLPCLSGIDAGDSRAFTSLAGVTHATAGRWGFPGLNDRCEKTREAR